MSEVRPESAASLEAMFGEPLAVFSPTPGKTAWGIAASIVLVLLSLLPLLQTENHGLWQPLGLCAFIAVPSLGLAYYVWRKRKWKLMLCPNGVIQTWASGTESMLWTQVHEVIATRSGSPEGPFLELMFVAKTSEMHIGGVDNYHDWRRLLETLFNAAQERGIPTRVHIDKTE